MIIASYIIGGLLLLLFGGEMLVRGAVSVARALGVPILIIGLTIVAIGTSVPEMLISISAALDGHSGIALGNVVGSNIANILLVLALSSMFGTIMVQRDVLVRDAPILAIVTVSAMIFSLTQEVISRAEGALLSTLFIVSLIITIIYARKQKEEQKREIIKEIEEDIPQLHSVPVAIIMCIIGSATVAGGAEVLVRGAAQLASTFGVPQSVIGVTIVAIGGSAPELVTCIIAARKSHGDIIIGNIIGSNILNLSAGLGLAAIASPIPVAHNFIWMDNPFMLAATALMLGFAIFAGKINRTFGIIGLMMYGAYITYQALQI